MSQIKTIKDITIPVLNKPLHFSPRYSPDSVCFYLDKFDSHRTAYYLASMVTNYHNINFNLLRINEIENPNTRIQVKQDLLHVLDDAIEKTFYTSPTIEEVSDPSYNLTIDEEHERNVEDGLFDENAKKRLEITMVKLLNTLVFMRTNNRCYTSDFIV